MLSAEKAAYYTCKTVQERTPGRKGHAMEYKECGNH